MNLYDLINLYHYLNYLINYFFQNEGFCFVHTPILTQNDCEGAGEVFSVQVNTLIFSTLVYDFVCLPVYTYSIFYKYSFYDFFHLPVYTCSIFYKYA